MHSKTTNISVLLIDGNLAESRLITEVFNRFQIRNNLFHVKDSENALNYLNKNGKYQNCKKPSLILLNLDLPKIDGGELLKIIKGNTQLKMIPIIMLISSSYEKEIIECYKNGASAVLVKPDDYDGFEDLICSLEDFWVNRTELPEFND